MKRIFTSMLLSAGLALTITSAMAAPGAPATQLKLHPEGGDRSELANFMSPDGSIRNISRDLPTNLPKELPTTKSARMKVPKLTSADESFNLYIIGNNVDGESWELASPNGLMEEIEYHVFVWEGSELSTGFKINDGTWDNNLIPGTSDAANIGSNGNKLVIGEAYYAYNGDTDNIFFDNDVEKVLNPYVKLDLPAGTILVTGTPVYSWEIDHELYLTGDFNSWGFGADYKMTRDDETGFYTLNDVIIPAGDHQFKIASADWVYQYGASTEGEYLYPGEEFYAIKEGYSYNIWAALDGIYTVTLDPSSVPTILFTKTGDIPPTLPEINYDQFVFISGGNTKVYYRMDPTDIENRYIVKDVPLGSDCYFYLYNLTNKAEAFVAPGENYNASVDEPSTLEYYNMATMSQNIWFMGCNGLNGIYDVTIDFNGDTAEVSLDWKEELVFMPETVCLYEYNKGNLGYPASVEGNTAVYNNIVLDPGDTSQIILSDYRTGKTFACGADGGVLTPENNTIELTSIDHMYYLILGDFDGIYELTVVYSEDYSTATVTIAPQESPDGVKNFDGNLYIEDGNRSVWADPDYGMTCIEPGLFKWTGEKLMTGFKIYGENVVSKFPDTDILINLGAPRDYYLNIGESLPVIISGDPFKFTNSYAYVKNAEITLDLRDMTLTVTGEPVLPEIDLDNLTFVTYSNEISTPHYPDSVEDGILYKNVPLNDFTNFYITTGKISYAWTESTGEDNAIVTDENLHTTLYTPGFYYANAELNGYYDIHAVLSEDRTQIDVTFTKSEQPSVDLSNFMLESTTGAVYTANLEGDGIVFHDVVVDDITGFGLYNKDLVLGWNGLDESNIPWITEENPETTIYAPQSVNDKIYYAYAYMDGYFDVFVTFNSFFTEAVMKFVKTGELYAYVTITMENGTSTCMRSEFGGSEYIRVNTNDPYWSIPGYTFNGVETMFDTPVHETDGSIQIPYDSNVDIVFYMEYTGECKVLDGTVGTEVELENMVRITRVADGVEIRDVELGEEIAVYTLGGQLVTLTKAQKTELSVTLEKGQGYIVRVGTKAVKVVM